MAHAFDTELALAQRTVARRGAVTLLSGLLRANGGYLEAVEPFGGVVRSYQDDVGIDEIRQLLNGRSPSIAIALGDRSSRPGGIGGFTFKGSLELIVYFFSQNKRGTVEGRLEIDATGLATDTIDPGLDVVQEHVEELLVGQYPGAVKAIKQVVPHAEELVISVADCTIWQQRYTVTIDRNIKANRNVTQLLESFRSFVRTTAAVDADPGALPSGNPTIPAGQAIGFDTPLP